MQQKSLVLILARDLADKLASAAFVVDAEGTLVYFNEGAEAILGESFAEAGELRMDQWATGFDARDQAGRPLGPEELPLVRAMRTHRPSHRSLSIRGRDGRGHRIAVTALPLFSRGDEFAGAMAIFWEDAGSPAGVPPDASSDDASPQGGR